MGNFAIGAVRSGHPRTLLRASDLSSFQARIVQSAPSGSPHLSWKDWWNGKLMPYTNTLLGLSDSTIANYEDIGRRLAALVLRGWINGDGTAAAKCISVLNYHRTNVSTSGWDEDQYRQTMLAYTLVLDCFWDEMTSTTRNLLGSYLINTVEEISSIDTSSYMDGHGAGHALHKIMAMGVLYGESGYSEAATKIDVALNYWFGASAGAPNRISLDRYYGADGGAGKGVWYSTISSQDSYMLMHVLNNLFTSMTVDGASWSPYTDEAWIEKQGEWYVNAYLRGDQDIFNIGNTLRQTNPWFPDEARNALACIINRGGTWRQPVRWLYELLDIKSGSQAFNQTVPFMLFDRGSASNLPVAPVNMATQPSRARLFSPPGSFFYRSTWDTLGQNNCIINIHCPDYYYQGHQGLDCGSIQINVRGDMVLLNSAYYHTGSGSDEERLGGDHDINWSKLSISKSGIPHIDDYTVASGPTGGESNVTSQFPHSNKNRSGSWTPCPSGQGGQYYRRFGSSGDPDDTITMTSQGSGLAWRRTQGYDGDNTKGLQIIADTSEYTHLSVDIHRAYLRVSSDYGAGGDRLAWCRIRYLVAKNAWTWPILFCVYSVKSTNANYRKMVPFRFFADPSVGPAPDGSSTRRITATGGFASQSGGQIIGGSGAGKCVIDIFQGSNYAYSKVGGGPVEITSYGSTQFAYRQDTSLTSLGSYVNHPGSITNPNVRHKTDMGRFRLEVIPSTQALEDKFVFAIMPMAFADSPPTISLTEDQNYYKMSVTFGGEIKVYWVHKTLDQVLGPSDPISDEPPAPPTNLDTSAGAVSGRVTVTGDFNTETDMEQGGLYKVFYREKV